MKEVKEVLKFVTSLGNGIDKALEDKKLSLADAPLFFEPMLAVIPAFEGISLAKDEWAAATEEQKAEIFAYVKEELKLNSERTEDLIIKGLELVSNIHDYVAMFKKA